MLRIVEIIPSLEKKGGAEVLLVGLVKEMSKKSDIIVHLVCLYDGIDESFQSLLKQCKNVSITFCSKRKGIDFKCAKRLRQAIKAFQPDVIHMHLSSLVTMFLAFPFGLKTVKLYQTVHNVPSKDSRGLNRFLRKYYCKKRDLRLIGISDVITRDIIKMFPFLSNRNQVFTIYNGVELAKEKRHKVTKKNDLICVASVKPVKNQIMLLKCAKQLKRYFPNIKIAILGDGEQLEEMVNFAKSNDLGNNTTFYGAVSNVYDYLNESKVFVLTSLYEGNPISILEALSCGLPCVVPNVGGIPDVIKHGENGLLFKVGDENEFINCVLKIFSDEKYYNNLCANAVDSVKKFSILSCAEQHLCLFKDN